MEPIRVELFVFAGRREVHCKKMNEPKDYMGLAHQRQLVLSKIQQVVAAIGTCRRIHRKPAAFCACRASFCGP